ncbi:MAG: hypothetical protein ABI992_09730, partial [Chthoniobacterales bacterium]
VLTREEKKVIAFILAAMALGLATEHYRAVHPRPALAPAAQEQRATKRAQRSTAAKTHSRRASKATTSPTPETAETERE